MIAEAVHFAGSSQAGSSQAGSSQAGSSQAGSSQAAASVLAQLRASPIRLEHTLIETELLRRRRATIVLDAHVHPRVHRPTAELMRWRSYAAAPLVVGSHVAGVIQAQAYESTTLRRTLRDERDQMREFLEWLRVRSSELTDASVTLSAGGHAPVSAGGHAPVAPPAPLPESAAAGAGTRDDRVVFEGLLTRRELDVLRLMAEGATNRQIADALVISSGTVKFHAGSILRKLHAANRAEAVTRYLRLMGMRVP
jgi:DNA-binding CsgD family transcriptional regulator